MAVKDKFTVVLYDDGSWAVENDDDLSAYVTTVGGGEAAYLRSRKGKEESTEAAIGYVASRMVASSNGFSY